MELLSSISGKVIIVTTNIIVAVAIHIPFLLNALLGGASAPPADSSSHTASVQTASSTITAQKQTQRIRPPAIISSSTVQADKLTVVVNCSNQNPYSIEVIKNGTSTQILPVYGSLTGISSCPKADILDINFDTYPDIVVASTNGSGGAGYNYWLYGTSTHEFSCPEGSAGCYLMNPTFDATAKTVTSTHKNGASNVVTDTYKIVDGKLSLSDETTYVVSDDSGEAGASVYVPTPIDRRSLAGGKFEDDMSPDGKFVAHTYNSEQGDAGVYITAADGTAATPIYCGYLKQWFADSKSIQVHVPETCGDNLPINQTFRLFVGGEVR